MTLKIQSPNDLDTGGDSAPAFASDAEIKLAEQLRRQLEEQYLGLSAAPTPSRSPTKQGH